MGSGIISWVVLLRPDLTDQQSSTWDGVSVMVFSWRSGVGGTVDIFVAYVFEAELDNLVGCCHDLALVDVAVVCIP